MNEDRNETCKTIEAKKSAVFKSLNKIAVVWKIEVFLEN